MSNIKMPPPEIFQEMEEKLKICCLTANLKVENIVKYNHSIMIVGPGIYFEWNQKKPGWIVSEIIRGFSVVKNEEETFYNELGRFPPEHIDAALIKGITQAVAVRLQEAMTEEEDDDEEY